MPESNIDNSAATSPEQPPAAPDTGSVEDLVARLQDDVALFKDQALRRAAEFENYKRRVERERVEWLAFANEKVLADMLSIVDDLERSLLAAQSSAAEDPMYAGIDLIRQKLLKILESYGVRPFDTVGTPFDVALHEALLQVDRDDVAPHTVVEEVQRGYKFNDKVLRHAKVVVSADHPAN